VGSAATIGATYEIFGAGGLVRSLATKLGVAASLGGSRSCSRVESGATSARDRLHDHEAEAPTALVSIAERVTRYLKPSKITAGTLDQLTCP